jgi:hypothetical protein
MITTSESIAAIAPAWSKASADIGGAKKDAKNPHFKSTYTTLASVIDAAREALKANDLFVVQSPGAIVDGAIQMRTRILHKSGEWIETLCEVPLGKRDPQGVGSAQTYARRYALSAALNIPAVDDDGEAATERNPAKQDAPKRDMSPHPEPEHTLDWGDILQAPSEGVTEKNPSQSRPVYTKLREGMRGCDGPADLARYVAQNKDEIWGMGSTARHYLREAYDTTLDNLMTKG